MLLNSFDFIILIPLILAVYYLASRFLFKGSTRLANILLLVISYAIYFWGQPVYTLLLFYVTLITYFGAILIDKNKLRRKRSLIGVLSVAGLLPLLVFKYYHFALNTVADLFRVFNVQIFDAGEASWIIPLGISFFTFQALGYLFEVYYGRLKAERHFLDYMLFVSFFPQIAAGPISKAQELLPQIKSRKLSGEMFSSGLKALLWGFFLKAALADRLAIIVNPVYENYANFSGTSCLMASLLYSLQIYGDFAGYSLMALGVGRLFGFDLINNFKRPYFSQSVSEFWRRWHISLSRWLKDYVYIPLGGSREGEVKTYRNILITFFVSGLWHGANFTFIIWGVIHGVVQAVEKYFKWNAPSSHKAVKCLKILVTFLVVNFAWIFFRMPTVHDAATLIGRIFRNAPGETIPISNTDMFCMAFTILVVFASEIVQEKGLRLNLFHHPRIGVRWAAYLIILFFIVLFGVLDGGQFIYVNF